MSKTPMRTEVPAAAIDPTAMVARLVRDGTLYTYVLPAKVDGVREGPVTLPQVQLFMESRRDIAEALLKADPTSDIYAHEFGCFASAARLIAACLSSTPIKQELRRLAAERARTEAAAVEREAAPTDDAPLPELPGADEAGTTE